MSARCPGSPSTENCMKESPTPPLPRPVPLYACCSHEASRPSGAALTPESRCTGQVRGRETFAQALNARSTWAGTARDKHCVWWAHPRPAQTHQDVVAVGGDGVGDLGEEP